MVLSKMILYLLQDGCIYSTQKEGPVHLIVAKRGIYEIYTPSVYLTSLVWFLFWQFACRRKGSM